WSHTSTPTQIVGAPDTIVVRMSAGGSTALFDLSIEAPSATMPGGSSIGAISEDSATVSWTRIAGTTGNAGAGDTGTTPTGDLGVAPDGGNGSPTCSGGTPGAAVVNPTCPTSIGGAGGPQPGPICAGNCLAGDDGLPALGLGTGGTGETVLGCSTLGL